MRIGSNWSYKKSSKNIMEEKNKQLAYEEQENLNSNSMAKLWSNWKKEKTWTTQNSIELKQWKKIKQIRAAKVTYITISDN